MTQTEVELWQNAHRLANEAHSITTLGWIRPADGRKHVPRLKTTLNQLSNCVRWLEDLNGKLEQPTEPTE